MAVGKARETFESELQSWIYLAVLTFALAPFGDPEGLSWRVQVDIRGSLFSALVLQLVLAIARADTLYFCCGCGLPYVRSKGYKRPNNGEANFCPSCGPEEAMRQANRRLYRKKVEARRLNANGFTATQIANALGTTLESINRWTKK